MELEFRGGAKFCIIESVSKIGWIGAGTDVVVVVDGWTAGCKGETDGDSLDDGLDSGFCTMFSNDIEFGTCFLGCDSFSKNLTKASASPSLL